MERVNFELPFGLCFRLLVHDWKTPWIMGNMQGTFNTISLVKDSWSESNPNGKYPVYGWADFLGKRNYDRISDINCYRGDYLAFS